MLQPSADEEFDITFKFEQTEAVFRWFLAHCRFGDDSRFYLFMKNNREYDEEKRFVFGSIKIGSGSSRIEICRVERSL